MSFQPLLFSGIILGKSSASGGAIGAPVTGADHNAILTTDGSGNLSDKVLTTGQILIGSTGSAPVPATISGTTSQVIVSTGPGSITLSLPQSIATTSSPTFANLNLNPSGSVDTTSVGTLAIGTANANIINIGNSGATVNIQGTTLYENVTQLQVKDPLITLNKGGGAGSASNSGIELEEAGAITGFAETSADRLSWTFKAPSTAGIALITPGVSGITLNQSSHNPVTLGTPSGLSLSNQVLSLAVATSTVTGALLSTDWSTFNSKQPAGNYLTALTGDGTATGPGSSLLILSTVNTTPGTFGSNSSVNTTTVNAKGLVTTIVNNPILITESQVTNLVSDLASKQPMGNYVTALTGDVTASGPGSAIATLATVNATPGTTGSASTTSTITTNAKGLVTVNTSTPIQIAESQVTNLVSDLASKQPVGNYVTALTGDGSASGPGSAAFTLATVNLSPGVTGSASSTSTITTNGKGLVTANTSTPIQITESQVTGLVSDLASKVTAVSVTTLNGLAGTSSGGPTPALTLSTTVTGVLKGNGTAISAAVSGVDYQPAGAYITSLTGDATGSGPGATALTLATVNSTPGSSGSVSSTSVIITNAKGLVTSNASTPIQITEAQVTNLISDLAGKQSAGNYITTISGDLTATGPGSVTGTLATVNTTIGTFGSASSVNTIIVNGKGLITNVVNKPIQITELQVTNLTSDLASKQPTGNYITTLTGDGTATGPGSASFILSTVNASPGSTGSASSTSTIITNAKGLVTSNTSTPIQITESQVTNLVSDLATKQPTGSYITALTGDATASGPGSAIITLVTVNSTPGVYGSASSHPTITVNTKGLATTITNTPIQIAESQVTNLVSDLSSKQPVGNYVTALTGDVTATGPGSVASTIITVGGSSAASVASAATAVASATNTITANTLIKRDVSGNFQVNTQTSTDNTTLPASTAFVQTGITSEATIRAAADALLIPLSQKGAANGVAPLDSNSKIPATYLPSYVDEVQPYANLVAFPATGATNVIYIANDTNKVYRWTGSSYIEISASPGSTDAVPEGSVNLYYTQARFNTAFAAKTTTNLSEGTNLYFTNARASAAAPVQTVSGRTGAVVLTKADVGLSNVLNLDQTNPTNIVQDSTHRFVSDAQIASFTSSSSSSITSLTGDITASGPGSAVGTLATVNVSPGITGSATSTSTITVNAKGLVTSSASTPIQITESQVTNLTTDLASKLTSVSVASSNGLSGTSSGGSSPTLTLSTTVSGVLKGNGTAISAAVAGTDYQIPGNYITALSGDVTAAGPNNATAAVAFVGGASASNIATTVGIVNVATSLSTASTLVKRDASSAASFKTVSLDGITSGTVSVTASPIQTAYTITLPAAAPVTGTALTYNGTNYVWGSPSSTAITALTGDATATGPGSATLTLATVNATPGTFGSASSTNTVLVNAKGLVTSVTNVPIQIAESQVTNLISDLAGKQPTGAYITSVTGDVTGSGPGAAALTLATVNVTPGGYGTASSHPAITVNAKGLVTVSSSIAIQIAESQVTGLVSDLASKVTAVSVVSANGLAGTSSGGATPALTLSTTITGVLKGNGTAISTATAGTDYQAPIALTTTGTSGPATFSANTLNIPNYQSGTGTVTSVSVTSANGFAGTVTTPTTTPIITVSTIVTGLLKGNGTAVSAAVAGTDYQAPGNYITSVTGDVTGSGPGAAALTLATVNVSPGTSGSASTTSTITTNAKGLVTSNASISIQVTESQVTNLVTDLASKQPTGNYITALTGDATASGPGSAAITLATVNTNIGTFNNVTVNSKGLVTAASNVAYASGSVGDVAPGSYSGLANNTANQSITGLAFANSISCFEALINIQITATSNTYTSVRIVGTNRAASWAGGDISAQITGDSITGLAFGITSAGVVTISVGSITGFTSGIIKYRAISLS